MASWHLKASSRLCHVKASSSLQRKIMQNKTWKKCKLTSNHQGPIKRLQKLIACSMCWQDLWQSRIRNSQKVVIWPSFGLLLLQPSIFLVPNTSLSTSTGDGIRYVCWVWWSSSRLFNCLGPGLGRLAPAFGVQLHAGHRRKAAFHNTSHTTLASLASLASVDKQQQP